MIINRSGIICNYYEEVPERLDDIFSYNADFILCKIPASSTELMNELANRGFQWRDLRLDCRIRLKNIQMIPRKKRFDINIIEHIEYIDFSELKKIYHEAFTTDRRFHLRENYDKELAGRIIDSYLSEAVNEKYTFVFCRYKGQLIAAACLKPYKDGFYIYLAGVIPKYQGSGAAIELYQTCLEYAIERDSTSVYGGISAVNTGVMNIYSDLNANFFAPKHLYVYERKS